MQAALDTPQEFCFGAILFRPADEKSDRDAAVRAATVHCRRVNESFGMRMSRNRAVPKSLLGRERRRRPDGNGPCSSEENRTVLSVATRWKYVSCLPSLPKTRSDSRNQCSIWSVRFSIGCRSYIRCGLRRRSAPRFSEPVSRTGATPGHERPRVRLLRVRGVRVGLMRVWDVG